jgi:hypothetical protein
LPGFNPLKKSGNGMGTDGGGKRRGRPRAPGESYEAARRRKESALADLRRIEVLAKAGTLVEIKAAEKMLFELIRAEREAWAGCPRSHAPTAGGSPPSSDPQHRPARPAVGTKMGTSEVPPQLNR